MWSPNWLRATSRVNVVGCVTQSIHYNIFACIYLFALNADQPDRLNMQTVALSGANGQAKEFCINCLANKTICVIVAMPQAVSHISHITQPSQHVTQKVIRHLNVIFRNGFIKRNTVVWLSSSDIIVYVNHLAYYAALWPWQLWRPWRLPSLY